MLHRRQVSLTESTAVGFKRLSGRSVGIAHDEDVLLSITARAERIEEDALRLQDDFGVVTRGLVGGRSIEVPAWESVDGSDLGRRQSAGLGSGVSDGINPNVFGQDGFLRVREGIVLGDDGRVQTGLSGNLSENSVQGRSLLGGRDRGESHGGRSAGGGDDGSGELHG